MILPWTRKHRRTALVARLLVPPCPDCPANPGRWCDTGFAGEAVRIGSRPPRHVHASRLAAAIAGGWASYSAVAAQFAGPLPAALTRPLIAARR